MGATTLGRRDIIGSFYAALEAYLGSTWINPISMLFQSNQELLLVWTRVRGLIAEVRTSMEAPKLWKNLETVGNAYIEYWDRESPGAYEAFAKRMGPPAKS